MRGNENTAMMGWQDPLGIAWLKTLEEVTDPHEG